MNKNHWNLVITITTFLICCTSYSQWNPNYSIGTSKGVYNFSYDVIPDKLVEVISPVYTATALTYQWEQSLTPLDIPVNSFTAIPNATASDYTFSQKLTQTTYFRRKAIKTSTDYVYSNIIKIAVVSATWEDISYIREHDILKSGLTSWTDVDKLAIGDKLQTTTYLDGLGRPLQKVSRETATPAAGSTLWGDVVQFSEYDAYGRQPKQYLPYTVTSTSETGKYKSAPVTDQAAYYSSVYNETSSYTEVTEYYNNPLNRPKTVKSPGTSWAAGAGNGASYEINTAADSVQIWSIGYTTGDAPVNGGIYAAGKLYKTTHTDENGKQVIEYTNTSGQLILTKTQIDDAPAGAHTGWICVYSIYDDFGLLRYRLQPEAVRYLAANSWSFTGTNGQQVLNELCFRYEYDDKGRNIIKKAPGATALRMLYDSRDRVVFMQDGNQAAKSPPEWTANLYDELDRPTITTLYRTAGTVANLQSAIDNSASLTTVTIANPAAPVTSLVVDKRVTTIPRYTAQTSIEFTDGFVSPDGDAFVAEIDATTSQSLTINTVVYHDPVTNADLNNASVCTVLKYQFYDDYSYPGAKPFDNSFDNTTAYPNTTSGVIAIAASARTTSFPTGSMVRVLGTNTFLSSTDYYDEKGRHIQTTEDNIKSGKDVTTLQYHWDGRLMSTHSKHTTAGSGYANFGIVTKNNFDNIGRVISVEKNYGGNGFKKIASYDFDDVGRLKNKHLHPGYTGSGKSEMEGLNYSYNIHNNITGINKDYALKKGSNYDKWSNYFGLCLGYDKKEDVFDNTQLDGHVSGIAWNTQGDDAQRKYDYAYDNAGRLTSAIFKEYTPPAGGAGGGWDNTTIDFSVSGSSGNITYDLNGNLLSMLQKGVLPGSATPAKIDDLTYQYTSYSNKLIRVTDNGTLGNANGSFGDFKDGNYPTLDDYAYDENGNIVIDLNKNIHDIGNTPGVGIRYNFLDKPEEIRIADKGTIRIVYDAEGNKLQKTYTPENGTPATTTTYINQYVYKGDELQYINFEEGRIRVIQPVSQSNGYDALAIDGNMDLRNGKKGVYDYYIRDYQENVRMILTEETHYSLGKCTMENDRAGNEEPVFGQTGAGNEVSSTRFSKPAGWTSNTTNNVSKLSKATGKPVGPNSLLKIMAGDEINASTQYYYEGTPSNNTNSFTTDILTSLASAISGSNVANSLTKSQVTTITSSLNSTPGFNSLVNPHQSSTDNLPKAYLTILYFDERFNYVGQGSTFERTTQSGDYAQPLVIASKAPKNGYAYIYVSNETDLPVYFDNLTVAHNRGRIIEEDHYYAFGLKIAGISSTKLSDPNEGHINNKNLYNDKELIDEADLNWYDYGFRNYDAQIGRFTQVDPLTDDYPELANYLYAFNDPIANIDVDGLFGGEIVKIGGVAHKAVGPGSGLLSGLKSAFVSAAASTTRLAVSVGANVARVGIEIYDHVKAGEDILSQIKPQQIVPGVAGTALLTIGATLYPSHAIKGGNRRPPKWYDLTTDDDEKDDGRYLYRFDTRSPDEIVKAGGFVAKGTDRSLRRHVLGQSYKNGTSAFVSTSKTREGALSAKGKRQSGYLYKIKYQIHGRDVNAEIPDNPFKFQREIAVEGMIPFIDINFLKTKFIP